MSWSNITKNLATFANAVKHFLLEYLLKEDGGFLLLETGDKIVLDQSSAYSYQTKHTS